MEIQIPDSTVQYGFVIEGSGAHNSRTIMVNELRLLLDACEAKAELEDYRAAAVGENALLKPTLSARQGTFRRLRELYGLKSTLLIFRALRDLWASDLAAQPMLALLCATARDPLLRVSAGLVQLTPFGDRLTVETLSNQVNQVFQDRYSSNSLHSMGQNLASSWQQSGHLQGRLKKVRVKVEAHPAATAYALFLGYLCGSRGDALFETGWCQLLDTPMNILREQAQVAARQGWLEYRHAGQVTDITFRHLLRDEVKEKQA